MVFGVLAVAATNLDVIARASIGMSGSVMIFTASIVVFGEYSFFLGPALIGLCCGLFDVVHLRKREWEKIAFNCASDALSLMGGDGSVPADRTAESDQRTPSMLGRRGRSLPPARTCC